MKTIITHPSFDYLWKELVERNPEKLQLGEVEFSNFPDGTPNLFIRSVKETIEHKEVTYIGDFSTMKDFFEQYALLASLVDYYANKIRIIVPYFNCGTMERISKKWEVATAKYLADLFSSLSSGRDSKNSLHTFDIHALQERFYFNSDRINAELHTTMSLIKESISPDTVIVFPDDGAAKRFAEDFEGYEKVICLKTRDGEKRKITIKEGNPNGRKCIIVDDLIQSGGTIIEASDLMREVGAIEVKAFTPHGVFPNESYQKVASHLDELIVTDSIPVNRRRQQDISNMSVFSILPLIEKVLLERK